MNKNLIETLSQAPVFAECERSTLETLQEHIHLENENLFPRAIKMEGLEE